MTKTTNINLKNVHTFELSEEPETREGVTRLWADPYEEIFIKIGEKEHKFTGPAVILVNQD